MPRRSPGTSPQVEAACASSSSSLLFTFNFFGFLFEIIELF